MKTYVEPAGAFAGEFGDETPALPQLKVVAVNELAGFANGLGIVNAVEDFIEAIRAVWRSKKLNLIRRHKRLPYVEAGALARLSGADA